MNEAIDPTANLLDPLAVITRFRDHDYTLTDFLASRVEQQATLPAMQFLGAVYTYAELDGLAARWATWLHAQGAQRGDRVAVMAANDAQTVPLLFGAARLGVILVPINPNYTASEAAYVLRNAAVLGVLVTPDTHAITVEALAEPGMAPWVAALDPATLTKVDAAGLPPIAGRADDPCIIIYTSGSTGFPKGAMHSQRSFVLTAEGFVERLWLQPDERVLCVMPLFHINALMYSLGGAIACGGTLVLERRFSASTFWQVAADTRATEVNLVAAAGAILARRPRSEFVPGHRIRKMFVAPQTTEMVAALQGEFGIPRLIECYGMTEIPGIISNPFGGPHVLGAMGVLGRHPDPRIERPQARIVDDQGADVPEGQPGELRVKTPTATLGYYGDPERTAEAFEDGWFKTGDLVTRDAQGYFRFVARKNDIIRRRGENVASAEIERVIGEHPDVADVAVIGVPSPLGEQDILAAIVPKTGTRLSGGAIAQWTAQRLAAHKIPRFISFVREIPQTATHKPAKHRLMDDPALFATAVDLQSPQSLTGGQP